jgi:hypothetical protein
MKNQTMRARLQKIYDELYAEAQTGQISCVKTSELAQRLAIEIARDPELLIDALRKKLQRKRRPIVTER